MNKIIYGNVYDYCKKKAEEIEDRFQLIYLDPPYNTKRKRGARKNYNDANNNWAQNMREVIINAHRALKKEGFLAVSINQMELFNLKPVIDTVFGAECFIGLFPVKIRHKDRQLMINATFHDVYEYLLLYRKEKSTRFFCESKVADPKKFVYRINILDDNPERKQIAGKQIEIFMPAQYEIVKQEECTTGCFRRYIIAGKLKTANWSGEWYENYLADMGTDLLIKVHGLEQEGLGYRWFITSNDKRKSGVYFQSLLNAGRPILPTNDLDFTDEVTNIYREGGAECDYKDSKKPEKLLGFLLDICTQENDEVLDMFGGSGTTLACCIKKNRNCTIIDNSKKAYEIMKARVRNMKNGLDIDGVKYEFEYEEEEI